jgi:Icc-related predicted phosphoesterase
MRLAHFSDIHGCIESLMQTPLDGVDVVVNTGDLFPNSSRGNREIEVAYQRAWVGEWVDQLATWIGNRPFVTLMGNHDFYEGLAADLIRCGVKACPIVGSHATVLDGLCFAGFGEIPYIAGEWNGEAREPELAALVEDTFDLQPDILVTHAPPAGILDEDLGKEGGISALTSALAYCPHKIKVHLFGHMHQDGGKMVEEMGVKFYNGATKLRFIEA